MATPRWRTKLDHQAIPIGAELHGVFLEPIGDDGGARSTVVIQVPEASAVEVQQAFETAARFQMRVVIISDTSEQATGIRQPRGEQAAAASPRRP